MDIVQAAAQGSHPLVGAYFLLAGAVLLIALFVVVLTRDKGSKK